MDASGSEFGAEAGAAGAESAAEQDPLVEATAAETAAEAATEAVADAAGAAADAVAQIPYAVYRPLRGIFEDYWGAKVTPQRPWPVILLHGTGQVKGIWETLGNKLREDGWATFAPDFGHRATDQINESIDMLVPYIEAVLHATGAKRAIIVGHSQGGLIATLLSLRIPHRIKHVVCLAAPNHGTHLGGIASGLSKFPVARNLLSNFVQNYWGPSGLQQLTGSKMVLSSDEQHDILGPGVTYTCLATKFDQLISPTQSCFLDDGGQDTVTNLYVQDRFPQAVVLHEQMAHDWRPGALTREALFKLVGEDFDPTAQQP